MEPFQHSETKMSIEITRARDKKPSRLSYQNILSFMEDPEHPSLGPFLRFINLTGNRHPHMELKLTRFKQVVYYITMYFFFSQYFRCMISLKLSAFLYILQTVPFHLGVPKTILFRKNYSDWEKLIGYVSATERQQIADNDDQVLDVLDGYTQKSRKVLYLFWAMCILCNISIFTEPYPKNTIVENGTDIYINLFDFYVPFIDQDSPPGYYYSMALQTVFGNIMSTYIVSWDSLVISMLIFFAGQLRISRVYCSKMVDPRCAVQTHRNIVHCHRFHTTLVGHQKQFGRLLSITMSIYLIVISINLGVNIIQISESTDDLPALVANVMFIFACLTQLLIFYWFSNQVTEESLSVSYGIIESEWPNMDAKVLKEISLMQHTTSKRLAFKAGPFNEMSLSTFIAILKSSYSFFTLLNETK